MREGPHLEPSKVIQKLELCIQRYPLVQEHCSPPTQTPGKWNVGEGYMTKRSREGARVYL